MLNSFWGKFGQRPNQTQVTTCTKPSEFFQIITDDRQVIHRIEIANERMVEIFHSFQEACDPVQTKVNIFIACFTTSYARLKVYNALDILQERVLYMDTDSVIYTQKPTELTIPTGNYLGEFTNELDDGDHITEFVAAGPKNYAYITKQGKKCCKVRGFTLNERGQKILHFASMKDLVLNEILLPEDKPRTLTLNNPTKSQDVHPQKPSKLYRKKSDTNSSLTNESSNSTAFNLILTAINAPRITTYKTQHHGQHGH